MGTQQCDTVIQFDMEKICRTCLKEREMQSIYEKNRYSKEDLTIVAMLTEFNVIQFTNEDELPNQVCIECAKEINKCYLFLKKCRSSDVIFRNCCKIYKQGHQVNIYNETNQDLQVDNEEENNEELSPIQFIDLNSFNSDNRTDENVEIYLDAESQDNAIASKVILTEESVSELLECEKDKPDEALLTKKIKSNSLYECKKCLVSFKTDEELFLHNQTSEHLKKPPKRKPCDVCHKSIESSRMRAHMRTHTQEKPHVCELCGASFNLKCNMHRHVQDTHKKIRPFKCEICQQRFSQKITLQGHMRSHTGEKPYKCSHCTKCFTCLRSLNRHVFNQHDNDMTIQQNDSKYQCDM